MIPYNTGFVDDRNTGHVLHGICFTSNNFVGSSALAEVCALLSAILVYIAATCCLSGNFFGINMID